MVTAFASIETAIAAMKRGALDYITKPFKNDEVLVVLRNALERRQLVSENRALRQNLQTALPQVREHHRPQPAHAPGLRPDHPGGAEPVDRARQRGERHRQGARGARAPHELAEGRAPVRHRELGNLPPDLLESNLFGHVKGAFTGAVYPKKGLFEVADKGSIFFDEIGNVPIETQAKLLRVIQEREFMRLGGLENIKVDVRIIAATNVDLRRMMEEGRFREDLYYRLHVITIQLPALRERKEDIPLLAQHFLGKYGEENGKIGMELTPDALDLLMEYDWPGNVRELENVIERAIVLCPGTRIDMELIPEHVRTSRPFQIPTFVVPPEGHFVQGSDERLRKAAHRVHARSRRRRAEARRRAPAHQADNAQRDDQAVRHPPAPQEGGLQQRHARSRARDRRGRGARAHAGVRVDSPREAEAHGPRSVRCPLRRPVQSANDRSRPPRPVPRAS